MLRPGINIFTYLIFRMRILFFCVFYFISVGLTAQVSVRADVLSGCNPLRVYFNIQPVSARDTIKSISWDFGTEDTSTSLSTKCDYKLAGEYPVSCIVNDLYRISLAGVIKVVECTDSLNLPNVFSPNNDGENDFFTVKTNGINVYSFSVFTRSGTLVYKTESPLILWDGRSLSGQKMKNGIYFYIIRRLDGEPLNEVKGIVYLFE